MEPGCRPRGTRRLGEPRYLRLGAGVEYLFAPDFFGHDAAVDTPQSGTPVASPDVIFTCQGVAYEPPNVA